MLIKYRQTINKTQTTFKRTALYDHIISRHVYIHSSTGIEMLLINMSEIVDFKILVWWKRLDLLMKPFYLKTWMSCRYVTYQSEFWSDKIS